MLKYKDLPSDTQVTLKLDGIPIQMNQTPTELGMLDNDAVYITITKYLRH
jgi:hypothetical protein